MNGYDFDKTILHGNSVSRFFRYCMWRMPQMWLLLPLLLIAVVLRAVRILNKENFLRMLELFLAWVPNKQKHVKKYWDKNLKHIKKWYLDAKRDDDLIISASPAFIVEEACSRLGVRCIASPTNKQGRVVNGHVYGAKKVEVYRREFGDTPLLTYYSDSMSDVPMFKLAQRGYLVKGEKITLLYENGQKVQK